MNSDSMPTRSIFRIIRETAPIIVIFAVIELAAGCLLVWVLEKIELLPGLLILVPGFLDMRGNISSAFGARLTSSMHLGFIRPYKITRGLKTNIYASIILSFFMSIILALMAWMLCIMMNISSISIWAFMFISLGTGVTSGVILIGLATLISFVSYTKGLDPDDVTTPSIGTLGDILTILCLFVIVHLAIGLGI